MAAGRTPPDAGEAESIRRERFFAAPGHFANVADKEVQPGCFPAFSLVSRLR